MLRRSKNRGYSKNSWLESSFSFSFAEYYDQDNMGLGVLRVLNDDKIASMSGFGDEILQIRQKAVLYRGTFEAGQNIRLSHKENLTGWYLFLIGGKIEIDGERLFGRDAFAADKEKDIDITVSANSDILLFDLPVNL